MQQNTIIENLFRSEYGKIIAVLVNKFGPSHLEKIEDAVQDALLKAMQVWGYKNIPESPTSWLLRVASNSLIDKFRRDKKMISNAEITSSFLNEAIASPEMVLGSTISDSQLKMLFACCHPSLSVDYQIILSLKLIGGFGNREIAKALLKKEETVAKSFTRAKKQLKTKIKTLEIPMEIGLQSRLSIVLKIVYLLFSEGYAASSGVSIIKRDICVEAIRLALLLSENKYCNTPNVHALISLMCFHAARFDARVDVHMELVDLERQNRKLYNKDLIAIGIQHLEQAATEDKLPSNYHLEAAVSYYHCVAKTFETTDWKRILHLYNLQLEQQYSPILELNRVIPYYKVFGAEKGMKELGDFEKSPHFISNGLYWAIKAELLLQLNKNKDAAVALKQAIDKSGNELEKRHLTKKLRDIANLSTK